MSTSRFLLLVILIAAGFTQSAHARRGNPNYSGLFTFQLHVFDSDDDDTLHRPVYKFIDTTFWGDHNPQTLFDKPRRLNFPSSDDAWLLGGPTSNRDTFLFSFIGTSVRSLLSRGGISSNGIFCFDTALASPQNHAFPDPPLKACLAALWCDLELRPGDTSKAFIRNTVDSVYYTFYNFGLKGTNGKVRVTFQVVFNDWDSSVNIHYKSFDGEFCGEPAAKIFQRLATIGCQSSNGQSWTHYLDRGVYYATNPNPAYAKDLHNGLAVRFMNMVGYNRIGLRSISSPDFPGFETNVGQFIPKVKVDNLTGDSLRVKLVNQIIDLKNNYTIYTRTDSATVFPFDFKEIATPSIGLACGSYRLKTTATLLGKATWIGTIKSSDPWLEDNVGTVDFHKYSSTPEFPNFDDFSTLDRCEFTYKGVLRDSAPLVFYDPPNPASGGALVFDRKNEFGEKYPYAGMGDTMISAPFNLLGRSNVWLAFSYQRGRKTDSTQAGIFLRTVSGVESRVTNGSTGVLSGDSLVIEAIPSGATALNPAPTSWVVIGTLYGGIDVGTKKYRLQIPSTYIHNHTRFRIRYITSDNRSKFCLPFDDDDAFIIDELQLNAPQFGRKDETDLEPLSIDLGNEPFTHIPRSVKNIVPKVRIASNGLQVASTIYWVHLVIRDVLNREVYNKTQQFVAPGARQDTTIPMPQWDIQGSQGGTFMAKAYIEKSPNEYRRINDTNYFARTFSIDDVYALDDELPDTAGTMARADGNFSYMFVPLAADSIRGVEFYHPQTGSSTWTLNIRRVAGGAPIATRAFTYTVNEAGWKRATFTPFYLSKDTAWMLQFQQTQGAAPAGDASRGLVWVTSNNGSQKTFAALYPPIISSFRDQSNTSYFTTSAVKNESGFGPLLPMVRLVFQGSSTYLPVELLSFEARRLKGGDVRLDFNTAREEHVRSFAIERNSGSEWVSVRELLSKNARTGASYTIFDQQTPNEKATYRLWEVALDGTRTMLATAEVGPVEINAPLAITCVPNPARDKFTIHLEGISNAPSIVIYNALGHAVMHIDHLTTSEVDAQLLPAGTYFVEVVDGIERARTKIVVTQ